LWNQGLNSFFLAIEWKRVVSVGQVGDLRYSGLGAKEEIVRGPCLSGVSLLIYLAAAPICYI